MIKEEAYFQLIDFAKEHPQIREVYVGVRRGRDIAYFHSVEIPDNWLHLDLKNLRNQLHIEGLANGVSLEAVHFSLDKLLASRKFNGKLIWKR